MEREKTHAEQIYNYPLYSVKRFPVFFRYCKSTAKTLSAQLSGGKKLALQLLADMMWCNLRYGAMDSRDYLLFEFWKKNSRERNSFFTKRRYFRLIKHFDKETFCHPNGKAFLYKKYADFIKRDWMLVDASTEENSISEFFTRNSHVLVKPMSSEQGQGIFIVSRNDDEERTRLYENSKKCSLILEEVCCNCSELNRINSNSLNTLRVYTIVRKDGEIEIPSVSLRCGCGDNVVDNWGSGGVGYPVDIETGIVYAPGVDKKGRKHIFHPGTDVIMPGFVIPRFKEACEMARQIVRKDMKVVFAGHDIAILPDRLELIEVNFPGGHDFLQTLDQIGKNKLMQSILQK